MADNKDQNKSKEKNEQEYKPGESPQSQRGPHNINQQAEQPKANIDAGKPSKKD